MKTSQEGIRVISERVRNYRIHYPLTQKQLADKSGVSLRSIQRFEKGEDILFGNLIKLLNALDLDESIEIIVPDVTRRPTAFVDKDHRPQRARTGKSVNNRVPKPFKWGDEK